MVTSRRNLGISRHDQNRTRQKRSIVQRVNDTLRLPKIFPVAVGFTYKDHALLMP